MKFVNKDDITIEFPDTPCPKSGNGKHLVSAPAVGWDTVEESGYVMVKCVNCQATVKEFVQFEMKDFEGAIH